MEIVTEGKASLITNDSLTAVANKNFELNSKYILPIIMLYLMATLAADVVAYKFVAFGPLIESGATLIFPFTYLLGDVVTEVYGYSTARKFIWLNLICELIFALLIIGVIRLDSPAFWSYQSDFEHSLGNVLRFVISGIIANIISDFFSVYIISKGKIFMKGKHFWFRSIASTCISELLLVVITGFSAFTGTTSLLNVAKIAGSAYILEIAYACIFVWPGWMLIIFLKKAEKIDVYDYNIDYNPFRY